MQTRRILAPCVALLIATAPTVLAQRNNNEQQQQQQQPPPQRSAAEQQDIQALVMAVEAVKGGQTAPADIPVTWQSNHFVKGQSGETYIPFTITVDRSTLKSPAAKLYIRAVDKNAPPPAAPAAPAEGQKPAPPAPVMYAWDKVYDVEVPQDGRLSRAIQLKPGEYDLFVAVKDKTPEAPAPQGNQRNRNEQQPAAAAAPTETTVPMGVLRKDLSVPDYTTADLKTSSVILATNVEPTQGQLSPADQEANPYVFGPMRIVANPDGRYSKGGELHVIFWIYGAQAAASGKPDVTVEYNFHQRLPEGEKYFNRTEPQDLNAQTLPAEFSVAAGHQLPGSLVVPMSAFPSGDYRLEIKVTDKAANTSVTENVNFTVLPV